MSLFLRFCCMGVASALGICRALASQPTSFELGLQPVFIESHEGALGKSGPSDFVFLLATGLSMGLASDCILQGPVPETSVPVRKMLFEIRAKELVGFSPPFLCSRRNICSWGHGRGAGGSSGLSVPATDV